MKGGRDHVGMGISSFTLKVRFMRATNFRKDNHYKEGKFMKNH